MKKKAPEIARATAAGLAVAFACLLAVLLLGVVKAAVPNIASSLGVANNSPQFPPPPEFCAVMKHGTNGPTLGSAHTDGTHHLAQRFTATSNYAICKISVTIGKVGAIDLATQLTIAIYEHDPAGLAGLGAPGALMTSKNYPINIVPTSSSDLSDSDITTQVTVRISPTDIANATIYWVAVYDPQGSVFSGNYIRWFVEGDFVTRANQVNADDAFFPAVNWEEYNDNRRFKFSVTGD